MITGKVFNIQRFSIHDGPGIRTNVFLKGCPLRCLWCHNPEGLSRETDIEFIPTKCIGCGRCTICKNGCHTMVDGFHVYNRENCTKCGECIEKCVADSLQIAGKDMTVEEVMKEVESDAMFYDESGGGMTLSGGEPLYQSDFAVELLKEAKSRGIHTAIETCGFYSEDVLRRALPYIDIFLFDYKVTGREAHKAATGVYPDVILNNLELINNYGTEIVLRCPIIPTINDNDSHYKAIAELANRLKNVTRIDLEAYHELGSSKYLNLGKAVTFTEKAPPKGVLEPVREYISALTVKKVTIS